MSKSKDWIVSTLTAVANIFSGENSCAGQYLSWQRLKSIYNTMVYCGALYGAEIAFYIDVWPHPPRSSNHYTMLRSWIIYPTRCRRISI